MKIKNKISKEHIKKVILLAKSSVEAENNKYQSIYFINKRIVNLQKHLETNKNDVDALRKLKKCQSQIRNFSSSVKPNLT